MKFYKIIKRVPQQFSNHKVAAQSGKPTGPAVLFLFIHNYRVQLRRFSVNMIGENKEWMHVHFLTKGSPFHFSNIF
jgi:hypothetical protein